MNPSQFWKAHSIIKASKEIGKAPSEERGRVFANGTDPHPRPESINYDRAADIPGVARDATSILPTQS